VYRYFIAESYQRRGQMPKSQETVLAFQKAVGQKDFAAARKLLQDNLEFQGPIDTFHKADDYLHAIQKLSAIVEGVDILKVFEDGNDVSLFYNLKTKNVGTSFVAEWYKVKDGRIASVHAVFDARPFAAVFAKQAG
jgi:limonene-1,2-epoxide hydrolase